MRPHWVRDLWTYWEWLDTLITNSGGFLTPQSLIEPSAVYDVDEPAADGSDWLLLDVPEHLLNFYDKHFLKFELTIDSDLNHLAYSFHYGEIGGEMIWRACMNDHRIETLGSATHLHLNREDNVLVSGEVDHDDAIHAVHSRRVPGV